MGWISVFVVGAGEGKVIVVMNVGDWEGGRVTEKRRGGTVRPLKGRKPTGKQKTAVGMG
ncbi:MAG: hypothetical protein V1930_02075 [Pseudomonadota bacterium]